LNAQWRRQALIVVVVQNTGQANVGQQQVNVNGAGG